MRVPKGVMRVCDVAPRENNRYSFGGVHLMRESDGVARATVTDGKRLISVTWTEDREAPVREALTDADKPSKSFSAIVSADIAKKADEAISEGPRHRAEGMDFLLVNESFDECKVELIAPRLNGEFRFIDDQIEGTFPPFKEVIPTHAVVREPQHDGKAITAASVDINGSQFVMLIQAMLAAAPDDVDQRITIEIPLCGTRPIKLKCGRDGREAVGVQMPLNPRGRG